MLIQGNDNSGFPSEVYNVSRRRQLARFTRFTIPGIDSLLLSRSNSNYTAADYPHVNVSLLYFWRYQTFRCCGSQNFYLGRAINCFSPWAVCTAPFATIGTSPRRGDAFLCPAAKMCDIFSLTFKYQEAFKGRSRFGETLGYA